MKKYVVFISFSLIILLSGPVFNQEAVLQGQQKDLALANIEIISISPTALRTEYQQDGFALDFKAGADEAYYDVPDGNITAYAPVNLPHGSTVTKFGVCFTDGSASGYMNITLERHNILTGDVETMVNAGSNGMPSSSERQIKVYASIANELIKNNKYTYHLKWYTYETTPGLIFHGAVIVCEN
jgi:hypothetical protein